MRQSGHRKRYCGAAAAAAAAVVGEQAKVCCRHSKQKVWAQGMVAMGRTKVVRQMGQVVSLGPSWVGDVVVVVVVVVVLEASSTVDWPLVKLTETPAMVVVLVPS